MKTDLTKIPKALILVQFPHEQRFLARQILFGISVNGAIDHDDEANWSWMGTHWLEAYCTSGEGIYMQAAWVSLEKIDLETGYVRVSQPKSDD